MRLLPPGLTGRWPKMKTFIDDINLACTECELCGKKIQASLEFEKV